MMYSTFLAVTLAALPTSVLAQTVEFFYTETVDTCKVGGVYIQANEQTTHGGICAWRPDVERVYGCPAPDTTCWTWGQTCTGSGIGQTVCNKAGAVWCCNAVAQETCTTAEGYINVCQSGFANPQSGVNIDHANQVYLAAIGLSNVTAISQIADPTPFSTTNLGSVSTSPTPTPSSSSSSSSSTTTESGPDSMSTSATETSSSSTASTTQSVSVSRTGIPSSTIASGTQSTSDSAVTGSSEPNTGSTSVITSTSTISGGAIAGIVVGALAVLGLVGASFFILGRRKNKSEGTYSNIDEPAAPSNMTAYEEKTANIAMSEVHRTQNGSSELGGNAVNRFEMPGGHENIAELQARPRHELA